MKKTLLLLLASLFLVSCPEEAEIMDLFHSADMTLPVVLDYSLKDNRIFIIEFSETVDMTEILFSGEALDPPGLGKSFSVPLPYTLEPGEEKRISFTVEKDNGSLTRVSLRVMGKNPDIPKVLINEVSIKGTSASPDRIELLVMEKGNAAGMRIEDGNWGFTLPSLGLNKDDLILIYWDKPTTRRHYLRSDGKMTYILNAYAPSTLSGTEGLLILKSDILNLLATSHLYTHCLLPLEAHLILTSPAFLSLTDSSSGMEERLTEQSSLLFNQYCIRTNCILSLHTLKHMYTDGMIGKKFLQ